MGLSLNVPDYSTLSKRSINLELSELAQTLKPSSHIIIDSTGLKVYGKDEWHQDKHGVNNSATKNRRWDRCARIKSDDFFDGERITINGNAHGRLHQGRGTIKVMHSHFKPKQMTTRDWLEATDKTF